MAASAALANEVVSWQSSIGALAAFIAAFASLIVALRTGRRVADVHVLVNSQKTLLEERVAQLTTALEASGVRIPDDPNSSRRF